MSSVANMSPIAPPRLSLLLMAGRSKSSCRVFCFPVPVQTFGCVRSGSGPTFFPATSNQTCCQAPDCFRDVRNWQARKREQRRCEWPRVGRFSLRPTT